MPESYYDKHFPNLKKIGFERTSEPDYYNCIAYVVGDFRRKWWPGEFPPSGKDYWPETVSNEETVEAFAAAFATVGFVECADGKKERGFEKIALYALGAEITHAARQMENGFWRSKLGEDEDIEHTLDGLDGPLYGTVIAFFKKKNGQSSDASGTGCLFGWLRIFTG